MFRPEGGAAAAVNQMGPTKAPDRINELFQRHVAWMAELPAWIWLIPATPKSASVIISNLLP
ncbi:MAG: hypothetical protein FJX25_17425 [Alphaproteobacteria bacterium]|nr:hypothetical protein [Alphaproteobacteria bacterium]